MDSIFVCLPSSLPVFAHVCPLARLCAWHNLSSFLLSTSVSVCLSAACEDVLTAVLSHLQALRWKKREGRSSLKRCRSWRRKTALWRWLVVSARSKCVDQPLLLKLWWWTGFFSHLFLQKAVSHFFNMSVSITHSLRRSVSGACFVQHQQFRTPKTQILLSHTTQESTKPQHLRIWKHHLLEKPEILTHYQNSLTFCC